MLVWIFCGLGGGILVWVVRCGSKVSIFSSILVIVSIIFCTHNGGSLLDMPG